MWRAARQGIRSRRRPPESNRMRPDDWTDEDEEDARQGLVWQTPDGHRPASMRGKGRPKFVIDLGDPAIVGDRHWLSKDSKEAEGQADH